MTAMIWINVSPNPQKQAQHYALRAQGQATLLALDKARLMGLQAAADAQYPEFALLSDQTARQWMTSGKGVQARDSNWH